MLQILVNCGDDYTDAATIVPNQSIRTISVQVSAPYFAICQVANKIVGGKPVFDQSEQAIQPGPITFTGCYGIRFRNFTPGKVAVVQANAYFVNEAVPEGNLPSTVAFTTAGSTSSGVTTLASFENLLAADVAIVNANQYYDGPSIALPAGKYLLIGKVLIDYAGANDCQAKLWDGVTVFDSAEFKRSGNTAGPEATLPLLGIVNPAVTTVYKISAACDVGGQAIKAALEHNAVGNNASHLVAVQIG